MTNKSNCPVCGAAGPEPVLDTAPLPVLANRLWGSAREAREAPTARLRLVLCDRCGHLWNSAFDQALVQYDEGYENSLHFSPRFARFAEALAHELSTRHRIEGGTVAEIGCGKGDFLKLLCRIGRCRGIGFDPSHEEKSEDPPVTVLRELYGERGAPAADLLVCRHCLEHVEAPVEMLAHVAELHGGQGPRPVYFEVPNALYMLRRGSVWDLVYEHFGYFTPASLARAFGRAGFRSMETVERFGGQFLSMHAIAGGATLARPSGIALSSEGVDHLRHAACRFAAAYRLEIERTRHRLRTALRDGKRVVVWGAGSKGVSFLNAVAREGEVEHVIDLSPRKWGRFVPGTAQQIAPPIRLRALRPAVVIVMNPAYLDEVRAMTHGLGLTCQVTAA